MQASAYTIKHSKGLSIIELMVALVLGLLVIGGVLQLFVGSKITYTSAEALARVQENGRFSIETLKRELRDAGSHGFCAGQMEIRNHLNEDCTGYVSVVFDPNQTITGWDYSGTGISETFTMPEDLTPTGIDLGNWDSRQEDGSQLSLPPPLQDQVVMGSDVFIVRSLDLLDVVVDSNQNNTNITLGSGDVPRRGIIMVTDCANGADIFQQSNANNAGGSLSKPSQSCTNPGPGNKPPGTSAWSTDYDASAQVFMATTTAYYIGYNEDREMPGLYRMAFSSGLRDEDIQPEELVEGVESMQVLYGFSLPAPDGDGQSVDFWLPADEVRDWSLVIALRITLLARSADNAGTELVQQTFNLSGAEIEANEDRRLRQPFSSTVALRNRLIIQ
ncbi:MAG: hypothetical protein GVY32_07790 [Gammaproteobacteria bacterium]|jgi:type IV pilus assembly protein PilW|nr:hypothetical protein [Gammaproteobacteria bacterium]